MILGVDLAMAATAVLLLVLLATIETAYVLMSDVSLAMLRGGSRAEGRLAFFEELMEDRERFHDTLLVGIYAIAVGISVLTVDAAHRLGIRHSVLSGFAVAFVIIFVCRLLVPRIIAQSAPEKVLLGLLPIFRPYYRVVSLIVRPFASLVAALRRPEPQTEPDDDGDDLDTTMSDIQALIDVGEEEGILEEAEGQMIQSIVELSETRVNEVMTPRPQIVAIPLDATLLEARDVMVDAKHSRLPVYNDQIDNIEGVVYVRDMLAAWREDRTDAAVAEIMRPAYFVPSAKPVSDLLEEMRKSMVQIALVIDEYGALAGLITIEDLLEEIVGEIEDEDGPVQDVVATDEAGVTLVKGSTDIRKLELFYGFELEADDFTTVAGLVINELGHLPAVGEKLSFRGIEFEVLESDGRRVNLVGLRHTPVAGTDPSPEATGRE